jgi:hypothetical protein
MGVRKNNRYVNRSEDKQNKYQRSRKSNRISKMVTVKIKSKLRKAD